MKKTTSIILLSSILALGTGSLASCSNSETKINEVYLYNVLLDSNDDIELTTTKTNYKAGETVEVSATLKNNKYNMLGIIVSGGVKASKVEGKENTFSFVMPEKAVSVKPITELVKFNINIEQDETKGIFTASTLGGQLVTKAATGQKILLTYEATDPLYMPLLVKANDKELMYDSDLLGYSFIMPSGDVKITSTYKESLFSLTVDSPRASTSLDSSFPGTTSLIYGLKIGQKSIPEAGFGLNVFEDIKPGEDITIVSTDDTSKTSGTRELLHVYINDKEVNFTKVDKPCKYEFESFKMPAGEAILKFVFDETEFIQINYDTPFGMDITVTDILAGKAYQMPYELPKDTWTMVSFDATPDQKLNTKLSGIYECASNRRVTGFSLKDNKYSAVLNDFTKDIRVQIVTTSSLADTYFAINGLRDSDPKNSILKVTNDLDFYLTLNEDYATTIEGFLTYENGVYKSSDSNLVITPIIKKPSTVSLLLVSYFDEQKGTTSYFTFAPDAYTTTLNYAPYESGVLAQIKANNNETTYWVLFNKDSAKVVELQNFDTAFKTDTPYTLVDGENEIDLIYDGEKLTKIQIS